jgi:hypothetical protein
MLESIPSKFSVMAIRIKNYSVAYISGNLGHQSSFKKIVSLGFHVIFSDYSLPSIKAMN